ncbi:MAG: hypothetical protein WAW39_16140 [Prosthecobacter sp.]|uniref:permease n=1 Tax=Prosthecobacter sp. TaxID=1965333 RepID=UPI003BAE445A
MKLNPPQDAAVTVSNSHDEHAASTRHFQRCVCEMKQLSFAGCERKAGETGVGGFSTLGRVKCWGGLGAFWGGVWGWLTGSTFFQHEGAGPLMVADPMVAWMMGAVEGCLMGGGLSAVWACVFSLVMPKRSRVI